MKTARIVGGCKRCRSKVRAIPRRFRSLAHIPLFEAVGAVGFRITTGNFFLMCVDAQNSAEREAIMNAYLPVTFLLPEAG